MGMVVNGIKLSQRVIAKSPGLLSMRYKLSKISNKLVLNPRTPSNWTDAGLPHEHDSRGHIWIIGTEFAEWVEENRKSAKPTNAGFEAPCEGFLLTQGDA